jgi:uroporphyrinogen-III synthase
LQEEETAELRLQDLRSPDAPFKEPDYAYLRKYLQQRRVTSREIKVYQLKPNNYDLETT